jgi:hypothetical protein
MSMGREQADSRMPIDIRLHAFLSARVHEMQAAIQQKATADFNTWLVGHPPPPLLPAGPQEVGISLRGWL